MNTTDRGYKKFGKKSNELSSYKIPWRLLSDEEKEEIVANAKKKKEERQRLENIKNADIIAGRQKTVLNSWE
jgi:predicted Fe-S protein YdhL (DUF1289 family)